jgi:hypothetical protein
MPLTLYVHKAYNTLGMFYQCYTSYSFAGGSGGE